MAFKDGDRVRLTKEHSGRDAGPVGTVVRGHGEGNYLVKFDPPFSGHSEDGRCWYVLEDKLASATAAPEFKVGDRVTFVTDNPNCGADYGRAGETVTVVGEVHHSGFYGDQVTVSGARCGFNPSAPVTALRPASDGPAAAPVPAEPVATYKVGDRVRMSDVSLEYAGQVATINKVDEFDDYLKYLVTIGDGDYGWVRQSDIVGPVEPAVAKVGDWVKDSEGDIGIVFHDDGDGSDNLHVGFIVSGGFDYYSAAQLTVVPAGTTKAANDNAPILAEIEELQTRIDRLRASVS